MKVLSEKEFRSKYENIVVLKNDDGTLRTACGWLFNTCPRSKKCYKCNGNTSNFITHNEGVEFWTKAEIKK